MSNKERNKQISQIRKEQTGEIVDFSVIEMLIDQHDVAVTAKKPTIDEQEEDMFVTAANNNFGPLPYKRG